MKIIGFLAICALGLWSTLLAILFLADAAPKYNIGGVPNSWLKRLLAIAACIFVAFMWFRVYQLAPFHIEVSP